MKSEYLLTVGDVSQLPELFNGIFLKGHREPRIAMVGRSNVGKSSLINSLLGGRLAQVSKQPGKTRAIHFYQWKDAKKIVADLPGYGYAKASKEEQARWKTFIDGYFDVDQNLERAVVLLDSRHGPTPVDREAIEFLQTRGVSMTFVFTKTDALKNQSQRAARQKDAIAALFDLGIQPQKVFWISSAENSGIKELARELSSEGQ